MKSRDVFDPLGTILVPNAKTTQFSNAQCTKEDETMFNLMDPYATRMRYNDMLREARQRRLAKKAMTARANRERRAAQRVS